MKNLTKAVFTGEATNQQKGLAFIIIFLPIAIALSLLIINGVLTVSTY